MIPVNIMPVQCLQKLGLAFDILVNWKQKEALNTIFNCSTALQFRSGCKERRQTLPVFSPHWERRLCNRKCVAYSHIAEKCLKAKSRCQWKIMLDIQKPWQIKEAVGLYPSSWILLPLFLISAECRLIQPAGHALWESPRWSPCKSASFSEGRHNCCQSFCFFPHCTVIILAGAQSQTRHWR